MLHLLNISTSSGSLPGTNVSACSSIDACQAVDCKSRVYLNGHTCKHVSKQGAPDTEQIFSIQTQHSHCIVDVAAGVQDESSCTCCFLLQSAVLAVKSRSLKQCVPSQMDISSHFRVAPKASSILRIDTKKACVASGACRTALPAAKCHVTCG